MSYFIPVTENIHLRRELCLTNYINDSLKELAEMERLLILSARSGKRDLELERDMKNETDYFLMLTMKAPNDK